MLTPLPKPRPNSVFCERSFLSSQYFAHIRSQSSFTEFPSFSCEVIEEMTKLVGYVLQTWDGMFPARPPD